MFKKAILLVVITLFSTNILAFDIGSVIKNSGADLVKAGTITSKDIINQARASAKHMDSQNKINEKETARLNKLVKKLTLPKMEGVKFNFKVYETEPDDINAFAMPDGTIRFHSALMNSMNDDQVLAVLGHEIGHVAEKHSFNQMRKALLTSAAIRGAAGQNSIGSEVYNSGAGEMAEKFVDASYSKADEYQADKYAVNVLNESGENPEAMADAIKVLKDKFGNGGGIMSTHPSNEKRIKKINKAISKLK